MIGVDGAGKLPCCVVFVTRAVTEWVDLRDDAVLCIIRTLPMVA